MQPYKFVPYLKPVIWGGQKIAAFKGMDVERTDIGESWEVSGVPGHESVSTERGIPNDPDLGLTLPALIAKYRERLVGKSVFSQFGTQFPLLVKFIDSRQDLSLQVHPNDTLAQMRHQCSGKTEMWYVMECEPGARIYTGLQRSLTPGEFEQIARKEVSPGENPFADIVASYESQSGDVFFLPPGRLHAIGAGNLLAEIQQTSDITYRVCDYGRLDSDGNTRQLHIDEARDAIDYTQVGNGRVQYDSHNDSATLVKCPYFTVFREEVSNEKRIDYGCDSFVIVVCLSGKADVNGISVQQGETLLVPAADNILEIKGTATLLTAIAESKDKVE